VLRRTSSDDPPREPSRLEVTVGRIAHTTSAYVRTHLRGLRRSTRRQVGASVVLGIVAAAATAALLVDLSSASAALGRRVTVAVAIAPLAPGDTVSTATVVLRSLPAGAVPATALSAVPIDGTLRQHLAPGEVLTEADLATEGADLPDGWRTIAIPRRGALPPLEPGARVDVIAASVVLAAGAVVVTVADDGVVVAVPAESAPAVATAAAAGEATLAGGG
jgi:hypothetical protein